MKSTFLSNGLSLHFCLGCQHVPQHFWSLEPFGKFKAKMFQQCFQGLFSLDYTPNSCHPAVENGKHNIRTLNPFQFLQDLARTFPQTHSVRPPFQRLLQCIGQKTDGLRSTTDKARAAIGLRLSKVSAMGDRIICATVLRRGPAPTQQR